MFNFMIKYVKVILLMKNLINRANYLRLRNMLQAKKKKVSLQLKIYFRPIHTHIQVFWNYVKLSKVQC